MTIAAAFWLSAGLGAGESGLLREGAASRDGLVDAAGAAPGDHDDDRDDEDAVGSDSGDGDEPGDHDDDRDDEDADGSDDDSGDGDEPGDHDDDRDDEDADGSDDYSGDGDEPGDSDQPGERDRRDGAAQPVSGIASASGSDMARP